MPGWFRRRYKDRLDVVADVIIKKVGEETVAIDTSTKEKIARGASSKEVFDRVLNSDNGNIAIYLVGGEYHVGDLDVVFKPGVNYIKIYGSGNAKLYGNVKVVGGVLNNAYGFFEIRDVILVASQELMIPALEIEYTRNTIIRDLVVVTDDVNLSNNNIAPASEPDNTLSGIVLKTQSGEQNILENIIVSGFNVGFDIESADHLLCFGCEARFSQIGFRDIQGFDRTYINPHVFNGYGNARMFVFGNNDYKPQNITIINLHDENCQSTTCSSRATIEVTKPDTYIRIYGGYISTTSSHTFATFPSGYKSWISFMDIDKVYTSNVVDIVVEGLDGSMVIGQGKVSLVGIRFVEPKIAYYDNIYRIAGIYKQVSTSTLLGAGTTTVISEDIPYNHGNNTILIFIDIDATNGSVEQDVDVVYRRIGANSTIEVEQKDTVHVVPGETFRTYFVDGFDRNGYALVKLTVENVGTADDQTSIRANMIWLK